MPYIPEAESFFAKYPAESKFATETRSIARSLAFDAAKITQGDRVLARFDSKGINLVRYMEEECREIGVPITLYHNDLAYDINEAQRRDESKIIELFDIQRELAASATKVLFIRCPDDPELLQRLPPKKYGAYITAFQQAYEKAFKGQTRWTAVDWPTEYEARIEDLDYDQYSAEFFRACNQDWHKIHDAQQRLIEKLDRSSELQFIVDNPDPLKRTSIRMSIAEFTFANSTIGRNYPGSEVFSAPSLESAEGQIYTPERFMYRGKIMQGIRLVVEHGRVIEAFAETENNTLQVLLAANERMRYFGEVAFGTNPGIRRQFINRNLVEKRAGTVHVALGFCVEDETYETLKGIQLLKANNGNLRSLASEHVDLVIPMFGRSRVLLDERVIQKNGRFIDRKFAALNAAA